MTFKDKDIHQAYVDDLRAGKNRRRYNWHEGRKRAYYVFASDKDSDDVSVVKRTTKPVKAFVVSLRGPCDLSNSNEFQNIKKGRGLNYPFLSKIENRILVMRALGKSRANIARALSGGIRRRSYTANSIKFITQKVRQKIREDQGRIKMVKISANIDEMIKDEMVRIAKHNGKTLNRVIFESMVEYVHNHEVENTYETERFTVDFNDFFKLRKRVMDLENKGVVGYTGTAADGDIQLHYKNGSTFPKSV